MSARRSKENVASSGRNIKEPSARAVCGFAVLFRKKPLPACICQDALPAALCGGRNTAIIAMQACGPRGAATTRMTIYSTGQDAHVLRRTAIPMRSRT